MRGVRLGESCGAGWGEVPSKMGREVQSVEGQGPFLWLMHASPLGDKSFFF